MLRLASPEYVVDGSDWLHHIGGVPSSLGYAQYRLIVLMGMMLPLIRGFIVIGVLRRGVWWSIQGSHRG